jgi:hypothetical protein
MVDETVYAGRRATRVSVGAGLCRPMPDSSAHAGPMILILSLPAELPVKPGHGRRVARQPEVLAGPPRSDFCSVVLPLQRLVRRRGG